LQPYRTADSQYYEGRPFVFEVVVRIASRSVPAFHRKPGLALP